MPDNFTDEKLLEIEGTDLSGPDLDRLCANASGPDLARLCDNASGPALARLFANASGQALARLKKIMGINLQTPIVKNLYSAILETLSEGTNTLEMSIPHTCKTTHSIAGWTVHLAGQAGYDLENKAGWQTAATLIHKASCPGTPWPYYYAKNDAAMAYIRARAKEEAPHV